MNFLNFDFLGFDYQLLDKNMYLRGSFNTRKSNMDNNKLKNPAYLFEVSWEVCNKSGGKFITDDFDKALNMEKEYSSSHILIGPDVWRYTEQNPEFIDDSPFVQVLAAESSPGRLAY